MDAAYLVDSSTGYIRLNKFAAETPKEVRDAIKKLKGEGMKNLILDLTDNGGGYLQAATEMLGEFLQPGEVAVYTEGLQSPRYDALAMPSGKRPMFADGRVVVMANQYTASAAEITSGALQDYDRGVIVGRRTFGKGLVQRPIPLPDGSMIRLTIAHYYTPTGRDIQKPYEKGNEEAYRKDIEERFNHGELMHRDSIKLADSTLYRTLRLARPVYGGGGILPDAFVGLDTTENSKYYRNVVAKGVLNRFVIDYVDEHRKEIKKRFRNDDAFVKGFEVTDEMLSQLKDMADKDKIDFNEEEFKRSRPLFCMSIKALIARDIYDNASYFKVYNSHDPIFCRAYEIITTEEYDSLLSPSQP